MIMVFDVCILMHGAVGTKTSTGVETDYAGVKNEKTEATNACPTVRPTISKNVPHVPRPVETQCPPGTYVASTTSAGYRVCAHCPAGTYTRFANLPECQEIIDQTAVQDPSCCDKLRSDCLACHAKMSEVEYCAKHPTIEGCWAFKAAQASP